MFQTSQHSGGITLKTRDSESMLLRLREDLSKMDDETFWGHLGTSLAEIKQKQHPTTNKTSKDPMRP